MPSHSRRAFLLGRRAPAPGWRAACAQLAVHVNGPVRVVSLDPRRAHLLARTAADVHHARDWCARHAVRLVLDGLPHAADFGAQAVLFVQPAPEWGQVERLPGVAPRWFVQPGCPLAALQRLGLRQFDGLPGQQSVAAWLADRAACDWPAGHTAASGLLFAQALLGDGVEVGLGAFGAHATRALPDLRQQRLVSRLFELHRQAPPAAPDGAWNGHYRLDALGPAAGEANLAHLLLGHAGELAWVQWLVLAPPPDAPAPVGAPSVPCAPRTGAALAHAADDALADAVRSAFNASTVFPVRGQWFAAA